MPSMPSISHSASVPWPARTPSWLLRVDALRWWGYQVGGYLALNVLDDPAYMALLFC